MRIFILSVLLTFSIDFFSQSWTQLSNVPMSHVITTSSFTIGNKGYVAFGKVPGTSSVNSSALYEYTPSSDSWSQKSSYPGSSRRNGVAFVIAGEAYAGLGWTGSTAYYDMKKYDPVNDRWTSIQSYPGNGGRGNFKGSIGGKGYVGGGSPSSSPSNDFWEYDPVNDSWTQKTSFPFGDRMVGISFTFNGFFYVGLGHDGNSNYSDLWRYSPTTNSWQQMASFPGAGRILPTYSQLNSKVIVGGGHRYGTGSIYNDYYEYDILSNSWRPICGYSSGQRSNGTSFTVNDTAYVGFGRTSTGSSNELWKLIQLPTSVRDTSFCQGSSLLLDASVNAGTYLWSDNSTGSSLIVNTPSTYWVEVTSNNCKKVDTFNVTQRPSPIFNLGADTILCVNETLTLDATNSGATYQWQDNSTNATFTVTEADTFYVAVDLNGCIASDSIVVDYQAYPVVNLGADTILCQGENLTLDATTNGATYEWQDNSTNSSYTVNQAGQYWVEVTTNGCSTSDTINVTYKPLPIVNLGNDTTLCDGETLTLDATNSGATYQWQDNSTNATFTVTEADTFYVAVDLNGCIASDTIVVDYQGSLPQIFTSDDTLICSSEEIVLDATLQQATSYLWSTNSTSSSIVVGDSAIYWVQVSAQCDTLTDSIRLRLKNCACDFEVPNVFTPNGDGINDYFSPNVKCQLLSYEMSIFNRWGDKVFYSNQPLLQWDGRVKGGKKAAQGYYTFVINYRDALSGQMHKEKGYFTLMY